MIIAGIDAGGTTTRGVFLNEQGKVLARETAGPANVQVVGFERAVEEIKSVVEKGLVKNGVNKIDILGIGVAGAGSPEDIEKIDSILDSFTGAGKIFITNDAHIALLGAHGGKPGIVVIAGTGSIASGMSKAGKIVRTGGWGPVLGDEGSGFWIGLQALKAVVKAEDGRGTNTILTAEISEHLNINKLRDLIGLIHQKKINREKISACAHLVIAAAEKGDMVAEDILDTAVEELSLLAVTINGKLNESRARVAVTGGLFNSPLIFNSFCRNLKEKGSYIVDGPINTPEYGAVFYGANKAGIRLNNLEIYRKGRN